MGVKDTFIIPGKDNSNPLNKMFIVHLNETELHSAYCNNNNNNKKDRNVKSPNTLQSIIYADKGRLNL